MAIVIIILEVQKSLKTFISERRVGLHVAGAALTLLACNSAAIASSHREAPFIGGQPTVAIPGCANGRMFIGQRKEPFFIAVGDIFDLFNYDPLGSQTGKNNDLEQKNVSSIALELPISCLVASDTVIGAFTTASLRQGRLLDASPGTSINGVVRSGGAWTQVSRVGMPLVNEVVIGLDDKDKFNASIPRNDAQFLQYVTNPTVPALVQSLFPTVTAPTNFPRTDLVAAFLTDLAGVNRPANVVRSGGCSVRRNAVYRRCAPGRN